MVLCKLVVWIFIEICSHQSSNWSNNYVVLPPISYDRQKNTSKKYMARFDIQMM